MAADFEAAVKIGETIRVRGIRPRRADIIAALRTATARQSSTAAPVMKMGTSRIIATTSWTDWRPKAQYACRGSGQKGELRLR
jgi:hypothetical protein